MSDPVLPAAGLSPWVTFGAVDRRQLTHWVTTGGWAVVDQGAFALSTLLVNVLLARWLSPSDYGAFVTSYAVFVLLSMVHAGIITDPLVVFGAGRYVSWFSQYLRRVVREHFLLTFAAAGVLAACALLLQRLQQPQVAVALLGIGCGAPFMLLASLTRRACYAQSRPQWAALGGMLNLIVVVVGMAALNATATLSILSAQALMAAAALLASAPVLPGLLRLTPEGAACQDLGGIRGAHLQFGRWTAASGVLTWANTQGFYLSLALLGGLAATASLRATLTLVLPIMHVDLAMAGLLLPVLVRSRGTPRRFRRVLRVAISGFAAEATCYGILLGVVGARAMYLLYGGKYSAEPGVFLLLAGVPLVYSLSNTCDAALRALEQPRKVFLGALAGTAVMLTAGIAAAHLWGAAGAIGGMLSALGLQAVLLAVALTRTMAGPERQVSYLTNVPDVSLP